MSAVIADIQNKGEKVLGRESLPGSAGALTPCTVDKHVRKVWVKGGPAFPETQELCEGPEATW